LVWSELYLTLKLHQVGRTGGGADSVGCAVYVCTGWILSINLILKELTG